MGNNHLFKNTSNIDFSEIKQELLTLFQSPNPFHIYMNSKVITEKFSGLLSSITLKIKQWFSLWDDEKTFIMTLYKQSWYDKVWCNIWEQYLTQSYTFDVLNYFYYVKYLNKDKQYLGKALLKMYKWVPENDIQKFLIKFNSSIGIKTVKRVYQEFMIWDMDFTIDLREDRIEYFLEKIYLQLSGDKQSRFMDYFKLSLETRKIDFHDIARVISRVIDISISDKELQEITYMISQWEVSQIKIYIDDLIQNFHSNSVSFYFEVSGIISSLPAHYRYMFRQYIRKTILDTYFPEMKNIFYDASSGIFHKKEDFTLLAWDLKLYQPASPEWEYLNTQYTQILDLKDIILGVYDNLFSAFLLPIVYYAIWEKLSVKKKDLYKMKYLLLFIFSDNYGEYKKIYKFFNQLEWFLNYEDKVLNIQKFQSSFSIIFLALIWIMLSYIYVPIWVFIWIVALATIKYTEVMHPDFFYRLKWNTGVKFFATLFLCISAYFWFGNFDKVKNDTIHLTQQVEVLWTLPVKDAVEGSLKYIKTSLFDRK